MRGDETHADVVDCIIENNAGSGAFATGVGVAVEVKDCCMRGDQMRGFHDARNVNKNSSVGGARDENKATTASHPTPTAQLTAVR